MESYKLMSLFVIIILVFGVGCTSLVGNVTATPIAATIQPITINSLPIQPTKTVRPTDLPTSTATPLPTNLPSATVLLTPSPTVQTLSANLLNVCTWDETGNITEATEMNGVLGPIKPLETDLEETDGNSILVGGTPIQQHEFPSLQGLGFIGFSPNGNWLAYSESPEDAESSEMFLQLLSFDGQIVRTPIPRKDPETNLFITWISNELMMILYYTHSGGPESSGTYVPDSFTIFDVFTGEERTELLNNLPYWYGWTRPYFSPDMTRVVYFSDSEIRDSYGDVGRALVLFDLEHQWVLWSKRAEGSILRLEERYLGDHGFMQGAFWSPDSSKFVFTTTEWKTESGLTYNTYLVDRDGTEDRVMINNSSLEGNMTAGGLWSPDNRFIYYVTPPGKTYLYDLFLNQPIELCIDSGGSVAWSPDSNYLAFVGQVEQEPHLLSLNVYTGEVVSIEVLDTISRFDWVAIEDWLTISIEE